MASTTDVRSLRTHIGKGIQFKGEIAGNEDVYIDGRVEGLVSLPAQSVTVGPNGDVRANVTIREMTIQGRLEGSVVAKERVEIAPTGSVTGELTTGRIAVHDGAFFKGKIDVVKAKDEPRPASQSLAQPGIPQGARPSHYARAATAGAEKAGENSAAEKSDSKPESDPS